jgi:hypothetical protein
LSTARGARRQWALGRVCHAQLCGRRQVHRRKKGVHRIVLRRLGLREIVLRLRRPAAGELHINDGVEPAAEQRLGRLLHHFRVGQRLQGADAIKTEELFSRPAPPAAHAPSGHLPAPSGSVQ